MLNNIFLALIFLNSMACHEQPSRDFFKTKTSENKMATKLPVNQGAIREGNTIKAVGNSLTFQIPNAWVKWQEENETYPNLHLTPDDLNAIQNAEGNWDKEYAIVINAVLPFEQCVAHVGSEGWGLNGISYADLQVRAYVLTDSPEKIKEVVVSKGTAAVSGFTGTPSNPTFEQSGKWQRILLEYFRMYSDYGAKANVDFRVRAFNGHTVCFVFMYTDHTNQSSSIDSMLNSVLF